MTGKWTSLVASGLVASSLALSSCGSGGQEQAPPPATPVIAPSTPPPADPYQAPPADAYQPPPSDPLPPVSDEPSLPPPSDTSFVAADPAPPVTTPDFPPIGAPSDPGFGRTSVPGSTPATSPGTSPGAPSGGIGAAPAGGATDLVSVLRAVNAATPGKVVEAKVKTKGTTTTWEIEMLDAKNMVVEMHVGADGRAIPGTQKPPKPEPKISAAMSVATVNIQQAIATALKTFPGTVDEAKLSHSKGFATWEVEIIGAAGNKAKIKVDAGKGTVVPY